MTRKKQKADGRDTFAYDEPATRAEHLKILAGQAQFDERRYLYDDRFIPGDASDPKSVHSIWEMIECVRKGKAEIGGSFLEADKKGNYRYRKIDGAKKFLEAVAVGNKMRKFREVDTFAYDDAGANAGLVGDDFTPLLGGPFNKQPYLYDYLRAHAVCFQAYHHDPFGRSIVHIKRDFVLGRGYRVDSDDPQALAAWRAFENVNKFQERVDHIVKEGSIYGENFIWWLPNMEINVAFEVAPGQEPKVGKIPRIRLLDPSTVWEIVTYPEDIERVLFYWVIFPTQYQIKNGTDAGSNVPSMKFVNQQLAAEDVQHFKYNCVSNEKRGRSDLFPVLGYMKWVRDCTNYKLIALKKQAAWTEDVVVTGSQADVDAVQQSFDSLGTFEPAGTRFFHTDKIKREYMANQHGGSGDDPTLEWGVNMIAIGSGIPVTYFGMSAQHGSTRAGALVGTEPVAKLMERRQLEIKRLIEAVWRRFQDKYGVKGSQCTVTFPEIISQDSAQKLKNIKFAEDCEYISHRTAAPMAAKEVDDDSYDYTEEQAQIHAEKCLHTDNTIGAPLTAPALAPAAGGAPQPPGSGSKAPSPQLQAPGSPRAPSAVTGNEKHAIAVRKGT